VYSVVFTCKTYLKGDEIKVFRLPQSPQEDLHVSECVNKIALTQTV